jgi:hypothetical protein
LRNTFINPDLQPAISPYPAPLAGRPVFTACLKTLWVICTLFLFAVSTLSPLWSAAQENNEKQMKQMDFFDLLKSKKKKEEQHNDTLVIHPYKLYISAFPVIGYNPALGAVVGATFNPAVFFGDPHNTPISAFAINAQVTSKNQLLLSIRSSIFTNHANFILKGDWRFYMFYQPTYGLGSNVRGVDSSIWIMPNGDAALSASSGSEPMRFDYLRIYETVNKRVIGRFYLGGGYNLDYHWNIKDSRLNLDSGHIYVTQLYIYSVRNGFNPEKYCLSGLSLSMLYDSRDNSCRPTKGIYASLIPRFNLAWIGSSKNSITVSAEFRTYVGLSKRNPAHLLAFWFNTGFLLYGQVPYLDLPAIGWDTYGRTGRGYVQGRIRGVDYLYGETEYRFPISRYSGILSGVVFLNATTCNNDDHSVRLFEYIAPAAGAGLRVMINKKSLSNLAVDMGFGLNGSKGIFLNINEAF